jgi:hypothetical protein
MAELPTDAVRSPRRHRHERAKFDRGNIAANNDAMGLE